MLSQYLLGMVCGLNVVSRMQGKSKVTFSKETMIGSLASYISEEKENFQPMNANFGILPALDLKIKDKKERYMRLAKRAIENITKTKHQFNIKN